MPPPTPAAARPALVCAACGQALPARTRKHVRRCRLCAARAALAIYVAATDAARARRRHKADEGA